MNTVSQKLNIINPRKVKLREPIYASIWLALFSDLRREFALLRSIG